MEQIENGKSANQIWKESGTTLSFADWIQREKDKGRFLPNKMIANFTENIANSIKDSVGLNDSKSIINTNNKVVGLNKWVLITSLVIIGGALTYSLIKKKK